MIPPLPRYGQASLAELLPSLLSGMGVAGFDNQLALPPADRVCLLMIDGLGWELLERHRTEAPFLRSLWASAQQLTTGFPSTTATSVACLGTGLAPGEHGIVGYTMVLPGHSRALNVLRWTTYGGGQPTDMRARLEPERMQPRATALERAATAGVEILLTGPASHDQSGLTRACLRAGRFHAAISGGDLAAASAAWLQSEGKRLVYAHHNDLDTVGHVRGGASAAWRQQLRLVDRLCAGLAEDLPSGAQLIITGDHGMVDLTADQRLDIDDLPGLHHGVRLMAGEGRARYLYTQHGATADVLGAWREAVGDRMWILTREEAIEAGWFGPRVTEEASQRIGDVIAAAHGPIGIFQRTQDASQAGLTGHHGSLTTAEQLVPLLQLSR